MMDLDCLKKTAKRYGRSFSTWATNPDGTLKKDISNSPYLITQTDDELRKDPKIIWYYVVYCTRNKSPINPKEEFYLHTDSHYWDMYCKEIERRQKGISKLAWRKMNPFIPKLLGTNTNDTFE